MFTTTGWNPMHSISRREFSRSMCKWTTAVLPITQVRRPKYHSQHRLFVFNNFQNQNYQLQDYGKIDNAKPSNEYWKLMKPVNAATKEAGYWILHSSSTLAYPLTTFIEYFHKCSVPSGFFHDINSTTAERHGPWKEWWLRSNEIFGSVLTKELRSGVSS